MVGERQVQCPVLLTDERGVWGELEITRKNKQKIRKTGYFKAIMISLLLSA